ncbi:copper homeostasis membrane protein CopD [Klebsiella sp. BIGb0407]|uniref:copper homeostasis membrane protein CopD n=1 Tax=Klebsiella sp. BIGb0407 TaxID=2940603 RepID=UPI002169BFA4|nr:copper homeostasis membrane protein CopD [Klebsiella sp. BIGb0407]
MLSACYIGLRFVHFTSLMLLFGCTTYSVLLAPGRLREMLVQRLQAVWRLAVDISLMSACLLLCLQAGLMGDGWMDVISPAVWIAVLGTQFGGVWIWLLAFALASAVVSVVRPRKMQEYLLLLTFLQLILLACVGHSTLHTGLTGILHRVNHAVHLLSAAFWVGGLLPLLVCMWLARKIAWSDTAIESMMRFSRYGHLAVAAVIMSGIMNSLLILGWNIPLESNYFRFLLLKIVLVGVMVILALINRYWLVPKFNHSALAKQRFIRLTWLEIILSAVVLLLVSLFATQEPF